MLPQAHGGGLFCTCQRKATCSVPFLLGAPTQTREVDPKQLSKAGVSGKFERSSGDNGHCWQKSEVLACTVSYSQVDEGQALPRMVGKSAAITG